MKKIIVLIMACIFMAPAVFASTGVSKKASPSTINIEIETKDHFLLTAALSYPSIKQKKYPLVVLLHSLGYSSQYWLGMESDFKKAGFAVLTIDFRGHGKSIYDANFKKQSWTYMSDKAFASYPQDVLDILVYVNDNYKNISVSNVAFVGADIGANTAVLAANKLKYKPIALALICPTTKFKGLYIPVTLAELSPVPVLLAYSQKDRHSVTEAGYLKKFIKGNLSEYTYPNGGFGMLMLKVNDGMDVDIVNWVVQQFNMTFENKKE